MIWAQSLHHYRLLNVYVEPADKTGADANSSRSYRVTINGSKLFSGLLLSCRESRQAALRFYRVHMQCRFGEQSQPPGMFYFSPEYDFFHLQSTCHSLKWAWHVVAFIHDFKATDPKGVGLVNLALDPDSTTSLCNGLMSKFNIPAGPLRAAFADFLVRVRQIIWMMHSKAGRVISFLSGAPLITRTHFNHSMPIMHETPSFDLFARDPRPVGPELGCVFTIMPQRPRWQDLLKWWDITQTSPANERALFAYRLGGDSWQHYPIVDLGTADRFITAEEFSWRTCQETNPLIGNRIRLETGREPPLEGPEELAAAVRPAIGFLAVSC